MRMPKYLSPTSLSTYEKNSTDFYLRYLADNRPDRDPQNHHMAIGSAFDAYVKAYLHDILFGKNADPKFEFKTLFEAQVEAQNRDRALANGKWAFVQYKRSGALADLLLELNKSITAPSFEFDVLGVVNGYREGKSINLDVPMFGKPDLRFINAEAGHVIKDWKVNGYYGKAGTSPKPLFKKCYDGWDHSVSARSKTHLQSHKDCVLIEREGMTIGSHYLEQVESTWADQMATYGWLMGEPVGKEIIIGIDQLACSNSGVSDCPLIRIAVHACRVSEEYQFKLLGRYQHLWQIINNGHFFEEFSKEESQERCKMLDENSFKITPEMSEDERLKIALCR